MRQRDCTDMQQLSQYLKALRQREGLTQEQVAQHLKITRQGYAHYEKGTRNLSIETWIKLAELYGMSIDQMLQEAIADNGNRPT